MAGVINKTARQFNLKCLNKEGSVVIIRLAPGFNIVNDDHWSAFVPKEGTVDKYVNYLETKGFIEFGSKQDDLELEQDGDTTTKSSVVPIVAKTVKGD